MFRNFSKSTIILFFLILILNSCSGGIKLPGGDAKKNPPDPKKRVAKNLEEGRGFRLSTAMNNKTGTTYDFASSNELWRASLDTIDFMPLVSANYSGGIIITDWYSEDQKEFVKISLRFLTNEIRADAIDIKVFYKTCIDFTNCSFFEKKSDLEDELKKEILKKATIYQKQNKDKNFKPYSYPTIGE